MKNLIIIGASALGRDIVSEFKDYDINYELKGFLDSRKDVLDGYKDYPPILDSVENYKVQPGDAFVCALGDSDMREKYVNIIKSKGGSFVTLIHKTSIIGKNVSIGEGCIIRPFAYIAQDTSIGDFCVIGIKAVVSHDNVLGNFVTLSPGCSSTGWCNLGKNVFMGVHSALIPHITLGNNVFVAAGAVVTKNFDSGRLMGVPAISK